MKRSMVFLICLLLGTAGLNTLAAVDFTREFDFLNDPEIIMLFAQNNPNSVDNLNEGKEIKLEVVIPQNAGEVDMDEVNRRVNEAMKRVDEATRDLDSIPGRRVISVDISGSSGDSPYIGIVTDNMTLGQASDLGYNKFYGVLITRVVPNSPASAQRLLPDDIIMEIDGHRITDRRIFNNVLNFYSVGDTVKMRLFRNRQEIVIDFTFGSRYADVDPADRERRVAVRKPKIDVGSGGGSWIPVWYMPELDDVNDLITKLGFSEIDDRGHFLNGGGLKGNIGGGLFLGGMLVGYSLDRKIGHTTDPANTGTAEDTVRRLKYNVRYGGITLEQRVGISRKLITSFGGMLGWGRTGIEVSQNKGHHIWNTIPDDLDSSINNYLNISKSHIFLQPKVELFYRLNDWLSIRGEVGYILSYSYHSGWKAEDSGDVYEVKGSPNTSFDGMTISIGPWFGF